MRGMGVLIPAGVADICPQGGVLWTDGRCVPEGLVGAPATWVLDVAIPVFAAVMVAVMVRDAIRKRRLTWWLLLSVCSAMCWWLETFGDWGQHLSYSPEFRHYTLDWVGTAPHNPDWMPLMYAVYWVAHAWAILRLAQYIQRRRPSLSLGKAIMVLTIPCLLYTSDAADERSSVDLGGRRILKKKNRKTNISQMIRYNIIQ